MSHPDFKRLKEEVRKIEKMDFQLRYDYAREGGELVQRALALFYVETQVVEVAKDNLPRVPVWALSFLRSRMVKPNGGRGVMSVTKLRMVDVAIRKAAKATASGKLSAKKHRARPSQGGVPWCKACNSWHAAPRDKEHHAALMCFEPWKDKQRTRPAIGLRAQRGGG